MDSKPTKRRIYAVVLADIALVAACFWFYTGVKGRIANAEDKYNAVKQAMAQNENAEFLAKIMTEVSDEAKEKLNKLLEAWADENVKVNFWVSDGVAERIGPDDEPTA